MSKNKEKRVVGVMSLKFYEKNKVNRLTFAAILILLLVYPYITQAEPLDSNKSETGEAEQEEADTNQKQIKD